MKTPIDPPGFRGEEVPTKFAVATQTATSSTDSGGNKKRTLNETRESNPAENQTEFSKLKSDLDKAERSTLMFEKRWRTEKTKRLRLEGMLECVNAAVNRFLEY